MSDVKCHVSNVNIFFLLSYIQSDLAIRWRVSHQRGYPVKFFFMNSQKLTYSWSRDICQFYRQNVKKSSSKKSSLYF